jgi:hypothetical protein
LTDNLIINEAILNSSSLTIDKNLKNFDCENLEKKKNKYLLKFSDFFIMEFDYKYRQMRVI